MVRSQKKIMSRDLQRPFTSLACVAASTLELIPKSRSSKGPSYQARPTPTAISTKPPKTPQTRSFMCMIFPPDALVVPLQHPTPSNASASAIRRIFIRLKRGSHPTARGRDLNFMSAGRLGMDDVPEANVRLSPFRPATPGDPRADRAAEARTDVT